MFGFRFPDRHLIHPRPRKRSLFGASTRLAKRKWTIAGFFLLVVLVVAAASFVMKPKYEAVARIAFNRETANPLGFKDLEGMPQDDEYSVSLDTQVQILQSDTLAAQAIREVRLDESGVFGGKTASPQLPLPVSPPKSKRGNLKRLDGLNRELTAVQADRIGKEANYRLTLAENAELTSRAEPNALIEN